MILQRDANIKIWGWAAENEKISIHFIDSTYNTIADSNGDWTILLPAMKTGGPYNMQIEATNSVIIHDIMIGDVWVCSGQSNMELSMSRVSPVYETEIAECENIHIRHFYVPRRYNFNEPKKDLESGEWKPANHENILDFSAAAYFFAKEIYNKYKVPVGLINTSLGGSPVEAWISEETLKEFPGYYKEAQRFKDSTLIKEIEESDNKKNDAWYTLLRQKDEGYKDSQNNWYNPSLNTTDWGSIKIPGYWADTELGPVNGVVWFRKKINIPAAVAGQSAKLILGRIIDADSVFINEVFVGSTSYQYPPRRYDIPRDLLKEGENVIVVRVINTSGKGGFVLDKQYEIISGEVIIDLKGIWQYKPGAEMEPLADRTSVRWKPLGLYNAMINPLLKYRIKGVIWYQGESNAGRPLEYRKLFPALIKNWRENWGHGNFPFLFVQLANYMQTKDQPSESNWALLREAQLKTLSLPNTGMAVTIDIGEWNDIHPLNKKDVGKRLALAAQKIAYDEENIVSSGPSYNSMTINGNKIVLSFKNIGGGLIVNGGGDLKYFAVAGSDKKFVWANTKIENNKVVVWSDAVSNPVAVRYAWADNPEGANLFNREGLPASPFRTDDFNSE